MLKKILGTIGTRYLIAFLNLALIFVNAKVLGVEGVGMIGLIAAAVNIAVIFNGILSGNTIVYFMNKYSMQTIFLPAYGWTLIGSAVACGCLSVAGILPEGYGTDIYLLSVLTSLVATNARFLLGKDNIKGFNLTFVIQGGLLFFILFAFYYIADWKEIRSYVRGLYVTNGIAFIASLILLIPYFKDWTHVAEKTGVEEGEQEKRSVLSVLREMFAYGLWSSADNLAEVCTTRLNYFLIQRFLGLGSVGLLDAGTKISESVWNISRSVSFIAYSNVARANSAEEQRRITIQFFKLTFCAIAFVICLILLIPEWVYTEYLFSAEFKGMQKIIWGLSVGVVAFGCNSIVSHYFIGSGKIRYSTASSCVGLVTLLIGGSVFIPAYGITGAAISTSLAFTAMLAFSLLVFTRLTGTRFRDFIPDRNDYKYIRERIASFHF